VKDIVDRLKRRDYAWSANEIEGITATKPEGAFYIFPKIHEIGKRWKTDMEFVIELLRVTGVLIVTALVSFVAKDFRVFSYRLCELEEAFNALEGS
jgi:aspartate/methionine/tyrosine aminotransferase